MKLRAHSSLFRLYTDGASRGNPGPSGAGAALYTPANTVHARLSSYLGHQTNNAAEYHAVLAGLLLARSLQVSRLLVLSDSQLLVNQISGRYSVLNPSLRVLHRRLSKMTQQFQVCRFAFIRREHNAVADSLANLAVDERAPLQLFLDCDNRADDVRKCFQQFHFAFSYNHATAQ